MADAFLTDIPNSISNAGSVRQLVENLYQGWGYNAYRKENQLRADDLLIRGKISELLSELRKAWTVREHSWCAEHLSPPTREQPYPEAGAVKEAHSIQSIQKRIESFESLVRTAPVPENDRVWQRHRNEAQTLDRLMVCDNNMLETLLGMLEQSVSSPVSDFSLASLEFFWRQRQGILSL